MFLSSRRVETYTIIHDDLERSIKKLTSGQGHEVTQVGSNGRTDGPCPAMGHVKLSLLNSADYPEYPDRKVGARTCATSFAYLRAVSSSILPFERFGLIKKAMSPHDKAAIELLKSRYFSFPKVNQRKNEFKSKLRNRFKNCRKPLNNAVINRERRDRGIVLKKRPASEGMPGMYPTTKKSRLCQRVILWFKDTHVNRSTISVIKYTVTSLLHHLAAHLFV